MGDQLCLGWGGVWAGSWMLHYGPSHWRKVFQGRTEPWGSGPCEAWCCHAVQNGGSHPVPLPSASGTIFVDCWVVSKTFKDWWTCCGLCKPFSSTVGKWLLKWELPSKPPGTHHVDWGRGRYQLNSSLNSSVITNSSTGLSMCQALFTVLSTRLPLIYLNPRITVWKWCCYDTSFTDEKNVGSLDHLPKVTCKQCLFI